ncbi:DUF5618 family protein [Spirosoma aureum]|uniref:DUF5618 family protein n=1 Tax=Spirosoma aureum TaxID=2692134 RepID=A0A6G9ALT6_9BACT|nr:DUF5618 family protein [Spirosoma aureum]QIP13452.1 DUF5618 family protein [Spirosoma aureum]
MFDNPVQEARRYIENARQTLSRSAQKDGRYYSDKKYVKTAGHQAYTGVLLALDAVTPKPKKGRKTEEFYRAEITKMDKKLLRSFNVAYENLHMFMGYDGATDVSVAESGLREAETIIDWVANRLS